MSHPLRLRHRVGECVAAERLWAPGDRVAVAVSGGLDSVVLLDVLVATRAWHGAALSVITVDHGTGPHSAALADRASEEAERHGLRCARVRLRLGAEASEERCRDARIAIFEGLSVDRVALAHHADDLVETVLLHLLRGAGTRGLAGMAARSGKRVRPLLGERREALLAWAQARGLRWLEDPTNASPRYLRNRVRNELIPLMEAIRPGATAAIARGAAFAAEDAALLEFLAPRAR